MEPNPETIELDIHELEALLDRIEATMGEEAVRPLRQVVASYLMVLELLREKNISIQRLRRILFGASTERTSQVLPPEAPGCPEDGQTQPCTDHAQSPPTDAATNTTSPGTNESEAPPQGCQSNNNNKPTPSKPPGHGRNPADAYSGCTRILITHPSLHPGDSCPDCAKGTLYRQARWSPIVRLKGQAPVGGTRYDLERLRCNLCGKIHTAPLPPEAGPDKYDPTVASVIAVLRYGQGMPWNRIQQMQQSAGVPLPRTVQWEQVRDAAERGPRAAYQHLLWLAAQGQLIHNDDTTMRVLDLMQKTKRQQPLREDAPERKGVFTTNILSVAEGRPNISLFFTGPHHAGENLRSLLASRSDQLPPPIQMCDASSRNMPDDLAVITANCLVHGRRNFVDLAQVFPAQVRYVLESLAKVYKTDREANKQGLSPEERLRYHQEHSGPVMDQLHQWLQTQINEKTVEPNSSLGAAISYMLRHWDELTLFLRVRGAPLDNSICEQALKMSIRHRNNSLFYKTLNGADIGDIYMTLIHTCYFAGADPFDYITQLQRHHHRVVADPAHWMPWNYREQLPASEGSWAAPRSPPEGHGVAAAPSTHNE